MSYMSCLFRIAVVTAIATSLLIAPSAGRAADVNDQSQLDSSRHARSADASQAAAANSAKPIRISSQDGPPAVTRLTGYSLENLLQISGRIYSGAQPQSKESFADLAKLGIKTIVSVDGARPNLDMAEKFGIAYVHIPIGYDGISKHAGDSLTRVAREMDGPIYLHCHHGKHRGPAAAAIVSLADGTSDQKAARRILQIAGTGRQYTGLYRVVETFAVPAADAKLPELVSVAEVEPMAEIMARVDRHFDALREEPQPHDALMIEEAFRELYRSVQRDATLYERDDPKAAAYIREWELAESVAKSLHAHLRNGQQDSFNSSLKLLQERCTQCHRDHRN